MNKLIISYSITPETYERLKVLAKEAGLSASQYFDELVADRWHVVKELDAQVQAIVSESETPAGS